MLPRGNSYLTQTQPHPNSLMHSHAGAWERDKLGAFEFKI